MNRGKFLTAIWTNLVIANYAVDPGILKSYVPSGTEIDDFQGTTYVSLVAFQFLQTKVFRIAIPMHRDFEEINLRFYVRRHHKNEIRRGVVFIREIVPRLAVALVARGVYEEPYISMPTKSTIEAGKFLYEWMFKNKWCYLAASFSDAGQIPLANSLEEFITKREWGYNKQSDGSTMEYRVEHPAWNVWNASDVSLSCDVEALYGSFFGSYLSKKPSSAFVADGSEVIVYRGTSLK